MRARREGTAVSPKRLPVSDDEWNVRVDLAAAYRLVARFGWDDLIYNHISARVPGEHDRFLLNPFGLMYDEVRASNLVKIDLEGNVVGESAYGINAAGFVIHGAVHEARPDVACVIHTHTVADNAVSAHADGLLPLNQTSMLFYGQLAYHDYEGPAFNLEERARLVHDLGGEYAMLLRNHGTLVVGRSVAEAFIITYYLQRACEMQVATLTGNVRLKDVPREIAEETARAFVRGMGAPRGQREWAALLRRLDREDPSYRE